MQNPAAFLRAMGGRIRERRIALRLTQNLLAKRAGVSRTTVTRIESGENIGLEPFYRLAIALGSESEFGALFPQQEVRNLDDILAAQRKPKRVRATKSAP